MRGIPGQEHAPTLARPFCSGIEKYIRTARLLLAEKAIYIWSFLFDTRIGDRWRLPSWFLLAVFFFLQVGRHQIDGLLFFSRRFTRKLHIYSGTRSGREPTKDGLITSRSDAS